MTCFSMAKSVTCSQPNRATFQLVKTKVKLERLTNKQQMKVAAVKPGRASLGSILRIGLQTLGSY